MRPESNDFTGRYRVYGNGHGSGKSEQMRNVLDWHIADHMRQVQADIELEMAFRMYYGDQYGESPAEWAVPPHHKQAYSDKHSKTKLGHVGDLKETRAIRIPFTLHPRS